MVRPSAEYLMKVLITSEPFLVLGSTGKAVYGKLITLPANPIKEKATEKILGLRRAFFNEKSRQKSAGYGLVEFIEDRT